jgi:prepilin-type N-terminal cleavage/methylation domain-containing protein
MTRACMKQSGMTLIEVITGMVVTAIITASAVPSVSDLLAEYRLVSATNVVAAEIARACTQASAAQRFVCVYVEGGAIRRQVAGPAATNCSTTSVPPEITQLQGVETSRSEVRFDPNGLAVVRNSVQVATSAGTKVVVTSILGKVAVL